jgi:hypothetical protein
MEIIKTGRKGRYLNTLEKYHIYEIGKDNLQMNYISLKPPQHSINTETSNLQMFKRPPHKKDNTNMLVEKTKNSRGK